MTLSIVLFLLGILGFVLNRKNIILMLISIEIMLLAVTVLVIVSSFAFDDIVGLSKLRCFHLNDCKKELRGWEWRYLAGMSERSERTIVAHDDMVFAFRHRVRLHARMIPI